MTVEQLIETTDGWRYDCHTVNRFSEEEYLTVESDAADSYYVKMDTPRMKGEFLISPVEGIEYDLERFMSIVELYKNPKKVREEVIRRQPINVEFDLER